MICRKLKNKLSLVLCLALLLKPMNALGSLEEKEKVQAILEGEKASYSGVLIPTDLFQFYEVKAGESDYLQRRLEDCIDKPPGGVVQVESSASVGVKESILLLLGGFVAGVAVERLVFK